MIHETLQINQGFKQLLESVRQIAVEVAATHAAEVDSKARFPVETLNALREAGVLSAGVPQKFGGAGCSLFEMAQLCATLAQACASSAMVLAMHYSQLACIARHGLESDFFRSYLQDMVRHQYLLASMTSEVGTFGETRSSICAVERDGERFILIKEATTGSYCAYADAILVTTRRNKEASASDQVLVLVKREDCTLTQTSGWDTLGMRGTCSPGFHLESSGPECQIIPGAYAESSAHSMLPFSHILWASLWWGIAADAVSKAASFVRTQARQQPGTVPPTASRLAEVTMQLQVMRHNWQSVAQAFDAIDPTPAAQEQLSSIGWALQLNNLKISCSEAAPQIIHRALQIVGILGYKNQGPFSLGRNYRDSLSASLMISNDRIAAKNASMLLVFKDAP